jgi:hypothetical protein
METRNKELQRRPILKKHAATIHCSNSLSLLQRKICNALLYHAYHELREREEHQIQIQELCNIIGYNGHNQAAIKEALKAIISTVIEWNVTDEKSGEEEWTASTILASVKIKGPLCRYSYSSHLKSLLHSPSMYGKINMIIQSKFKSSYGLALYENCIRFCGLPSTRWFEMEVFRKLMGVPDSIYVIFRDFKRRVIDKAVEEVNSHSDLIIHAEYKKKARQVTEIRFSLKERPRKPHLGKVQKEGDLSNEDDLVKELVHSWGINIQIVQQWIEQLGREQIIKNIHYVKSSSAFKDKTIQRLGGYLKRAVEENYADQAEAFVLTPVPQPQLAKTNQLKKLYQEDYQNYRIIESLEIFKNLSDAQQSQIKDEFEKKCPHPALVYCFQHYGLDHVKDVFVDHLQQFHSNLLSSVSSYEEFILMRTKSA